MNNITYLCMKSLLDMRNVGIEEFKIVTVYPKS